MELKIYKPTSNSLRHLISIKKNLLSKNGRLLKYSLRTFHNDDMWSQRDTLSRGRKKSIEIAEKIRIYSNA